MSPGDVSTLDLKAPSASDVKQFNEAAGMAVPFSPVASTPVAPPASDAQSQEISLIKQVIPLLQQLIGAMGGAAPPATPAPAPAPASATGEPPAPAPSPSSGAPPSAAPASAAPPDATPASGSAPPSSTSALVPQLISLLQQLLAALQGGGASGGGAGSPAAPPGAAPASGGTEAALMQQLIPMLQQQVGAGGTPSAPPAEPGSVSAQIVPLLQQLIADLQGQGGGLGGPPSPGGPAPITAAAMPPAPSYNPSSGISGAEIDAMLSRANGTGPEVVFSDYGMAPSSQSPQGSPTAGGQVSGLNQQMGGEAA